MTKRIIDFGKIIGKIGMVLKILRNERQYPQPVFFFIGFEIEYGHSALEHQAQLFHRSN